MEWVLATANPDKAEEMAAILGGSVDLVRRPAGLPEVAETGATLLANARLKAWAVAGATGRPAIADDTGLEVEALGGAPGVMSARWAGPGATYADNVAKLLGQLEGKGGPARRARFCTVVVAAAPGAGEVVAEGQVMGRIAERPAGSGGFGYDAVFVPDEGGGRTFAELAAEDPGIKHSISHRGRALRALRDQMATLGDGLAQP
ncbi:MAG: RdgB/HAM1 family non-canonical purine NTP pyrophosphatase [Acidimicrobiales bacterium]